MFRGVSRGEDEIDEGIKGADEFSEGPLVDRRQTTAGLGREAGSDGKRVTPVLWSW